jgi:hypothetical protein
MTIWRVLLAGSGWGKMSDNGSASGNASSSRNCCLATSFLRVRVVPIGMEILRKSY